MNKPTIEDMKAELEANGYVVKRRRQGMYEFDHLCMPDGIELTIDTFGMIRLAYAHLQQQRILVDLRALKATIWSLDENIEPNIHNATVAKQVIDFLIRHNITAPDDESDATQDRLASLYPDDESEET